MNPLLPPTSGACRRFLFPFALAAAATLPLAAQQAGTPPSPVLDIGSRRELFVDEFLVGTLAGKAELKLHSPVPQEVVMEFNRPWEGNNSIYFSVFKDGDRFRMYYRGNHAEYTKGTPSVGTQAPAGEVPYPSSTLCYAESDDGIHWRRPDVGIFNLKGWEKNNVVLVSGKVGPFEEISPDSAVFKDENPAASPDARYKLMLWSNKPKGPLPMKSPDGIHWSLMSLDKPVIRAGGAQNLAFWDAERKEYRAYYRSSVLRRRPQFNGFRSIGTSVSSDFLHWSKLSDVTYEHPPVIKTVSQDFLDSYKIPDQAHVKTPVEEHLYDNAITPYPRAPHIFVGFPVRYIERPWSASMSALPDVKHRHIRSNVEERLGTAMTEGLLVASHDGIKFKRWSEAFLRPGLERHGTWDYGHQYIAWGFLETKSALEGGPNELSLFSTERYMIDRGTLLRRYTLRLDGFASLQAPMSGGELITKPLRFSGKELVLNFSTSAAGSVRIEIQGLDGKPLPGYSLADCPPLFGDTIERTVTWANGSDVSALAGQAVRLRIALEDADVYALQFKD